jgi:predicted secreted Zn-dependent protease
LEYGVAGGALVSKSAARAPGAAALTAIAMTNFFMTSERDAAHARARMRNWFIEKVRGHEVQRTRLAIW